MEWHSAQDGAKTAAYWRENLEHVEPTLLFSGAMGLMEPPASKQREYKVLEFQFSETETQQIKTFAEKHSVTLSLTMQSIWAVLLARYNNSRQVMFGTAVTVRPAPLKVENCVGPFINTIPIRVTVTESDTMATIVDSVKKQQLQREGHEHAFLADIHSWTGLSKEAALFDTVFVFENYPVGSGTQQPSDQQLHVEPVDFTEQTHFPLAVTASMDKHMNIRITYEVTRIKPDLITCLARHLKHLTLDLVRNENSPVSSMKLLHGRERDQVLHKWNSHEPVVADPLQGCCTHHLVEQQVARAPHNVALVYANGLRSMTYQELNIASDAIAAQLYSHLQRLVPRGLDKKRATLPTPVIGLCVEQSSWHMIAGMLATWKSGAAYLPLDPKLPADRLRHMITDARLTLTLCQCNLEDKLPQTDPKVPVIIMDPLFGRKPQSKAATKPDIKYQPNSIAYVIYTSGSSGLPKGVAIEHKSLVNWAWHGAKILNHTTDTRVLQTFPFSFDGHLVDTVTSLVAGSILYLKPDHIVAGEELAEYLNKHEINCIALTPTRLATLEGFVFPHLSVIAAGGEALPQKLVQMFSPRYFIYFR